MQKKKRITVIGAGALGTNAALMLDKKGYEVTLLEITDDILMGGSAVAANITHSDGFEYHKPGHQKTGEYCIDGAIAKALLFPIKTYTTRYCSIEKPIRFLISKDSENIDGLTKENFANNAEHMRAHFTQHFHYLTQTRTHDKALTEKFLGRNPQNFAHPLAPEEYADCDRIVYGYAGSGTSIDMPYYYALLKAALRESHIDIQFNQQVSDIEKQIDGTYLITSNDQIIQTDHIIIAAAHQVPALCAKIKNTTFYKTENPPSTAGTYYLNAITYINLPALSDTNQTEALSRLNFILQAEGGCMYVCIVPPTAQSAGYGAVYYPSEKGSQLKKYLYNKNQHQLPPITEWEMYIKNGLPNHHPHVIATMEQAYRYYPFLKNYAIVDKTICRTVFNAATQDSDSGLERRVRGITTADIITDDKHVTAFRSPKWTNAELVAMIAVDQVLQIFGDEPLPKNAENGFGPTSLDVEKITHDLNFHHIKTKVEDARHYVRKNQLPERLIAKKESEFHV